MDAQGTTSDYSVSRNHVHSHIPTSVDVLFHLIRQALNHACTKSKRRRKDHSTANLLSETASIYYTASSR